MPLYVKMSQNINETTRHLKFRYILILTNLLRTDLCIYTYIYTYIYIYIHIYIYIYIYIIIAMSVSDHTVLKKSYLQ